MRFIIYLVLISIFFGCDNSFNYKSLYCNLNENSISENDSILFIQDRDLKDELSNLPWRFKLVADFNEKYLDEVKTVIVLKTLFPLLEKTPSSFTSQLLFLFETEDVIAYKTISKFSYIHNSMNNKPKQIIFKDTETSIENNFKIESIDQSELFPFSFTEKIKSLPNINTNNLLFSFNIKRKDFNPIYIVLNIKTHDGKSLFYEKYEITSPYDTLWNKYSNELTIPNLVSGNDNLIFYIYNAKRAHFLIKNLALSFNSKLTGNDHLSNELIYQFSNDFNTMIDYGKWTESGRFIKRDDQLNGYLHSKFEKSSFAHYTSLINDMNINGSETILFSGNFKANEKEGEVKINYLVERFNSDTVFYKQIPIPLTTNWKNVNLNIPIDEQFSDKDRFRFWIDFDSLSVDCDDIINSFVKSK